MGNYVFDADALVDAVTRDAERDGSRHDMGGDIVPDFVDRGEAAVYDFIDNDVPGSTDRDRDYWRDVGTLDAYFEAQMDLVSVHPVFNLYNYEWPMYTNLGPWPPAKFVHGWHGRIGHAVNSIVSPGCVVSGALVENSVLSPMVQVHSWATVSDSVLMDNVDIGRHCGGTPGNPGQERRGARRRPDRDGPRRGPRPRLHRDRVGDHRDRQGAEGQPLRACRQAGEACGPVRRVPVRTGVRTGA